MHTILSLQVLHGIWLIWNSVKGENLECNIYHIFLLLKDKKKKIFEERKKSYIIFVSSNNSYVSSRYVNGQYALLVFHYYSYKQNQ